MIWAWSIKIHYTGRSFEANLGRMRFGGLEVPSRASQATGPAHLLQLSRRDRKRKEGRYEGSSDSLPLIRGLCFETYMYLSIYLSIYIYIHMIIYVYINIYIYIHIYIYDQYLWSTFTFVSFAHKEETSIEKRLQCFSPVDHFQVSVGVCQVFARKHRSGFKILISGEVAERFWSGQSFG